MSRETFFWEMCLLKFNFLIVMVGAWGIIAIILGIISDDIWMPRIMALMMCVPIMALGSMIFLL